MIQDSYSQCRTRFLRSAEQAGFQLAQSPCLGVDPSQEPLHQDFASLSSGNSRVHVLLSGVHGVEGYLGSMAQAKILDSFKKSSKQVKSDADLCFVHAVSPFAMAWYRRANENNVDLNRNGESDSGNRLGSDPLYKKFLPWFQAQSKAIFWLNFIRSLMLTLRFGINKTNQAIAGGQSDYPHGVFFSGNEIQKELSSLSAELKRLFPEAKEFIFLDIHTGLGPFAGEALILHEKALVEYRSELEELFGTNLVDPKKIKHFYQAKGTLGEYLERQLSPSKVLHITQEFGTYSAVKVLSTLVSENSQFASRRPGSKLDHRQAHKMLSCFFPDSAIWRKKTVEAVEFRWAQLDKISFSKGKR